MSTAASYATACSWSHCRGGRSTGLLLGDALYVYPQAREDLNAEDPLYCPRSRVTCLDNSYVDLSYPRMERLDSIPSRGRGR